MVMMVCAYNIFIVVVVRDKVVLKLGFNYYSEKVLFSSLLTVLILLFHFLAFPHII